MSGSRIIVPIVLVICALVATPLAAEECTMHENSKIVPAEGEREDVFGRSVAISNDAGVIRLVIGAAREDDREHNTGAAYVLRYDPQSSGWVQEAKLLNDDGEEWGLFGLSVSIFGDTIVAGSGNLQNGSWPGAAHVFRRDRDDSRWVQEAELLAFDGGEDDRFGTVVRISGDVVVVGAERADNFSGAAYVFRFDGKTWGQEAKLTSNVHGLWFGNAVGASGDRVIIGAQRDVENGYWAGAAYVFRFDGESWIREAKLLADDGEENDWFGSSVAISGDVALVGAMRKDGENGGNQGAAYFFRFDAESKRWIQEAKLTPPSGGEFGLSADLSGDLAVIGVGDSENGNQAGAAYVARFGEGGWVLEAKLLASVGGPQQWFGYSVGIAGETVVAGAYGDGENGYESGAAFVFHELFSDCNDNERPDLCDTFDGTSGDCNDNRIPDECDIADGTSEDTNEDGVPDECQGACCVREGVCTDFVTEDDCQGRYAAQTACDALDPPCMEVTGACCKVDGHCEDDVPLSHCGGSFEDETRCWEMRPRCVPIGACCDPIGTCEDDVRGDECTEQFSPLLLCEDLDPACGAELGACCVAGDCLATNRFAECEESDGHWFKGETCDDGFECPIDRTCPVWDNDIHFNEFSGRAISPPNFPDIRVADDFVIPEGGCAVRSVQIFVIEDAGWYDGEDITITIYADTDGNGPGEIVAQVTTYFESQPPPSEECIGHRICAIYLVRDLDISLPGGSYWLGVRNPRGSGSGTNYWMTSDGGEDGGESDTGWFSLNGGETWSPEGAGWHHAFEINTGSGFGACCRTDGGCSDYVYEDDCDDRFAEGVLCEDLEPGFCTGACCSPDGTCEDFVSQDECGRREWDQGQQCDELSPPCAPYCPAYEAAKLLAPDGPERHRFGASLALAHRTLAVGTNRAGGGIGLQAVHIYQLEGTHWRWEAALTPPEEVREGFGWPIGLDRSSGSRVVAGVPRREEPGIAYVFRRGADGWALEAKLFAVGGSPSDGYGAAVAVYGDVIAVAARGDDDERGRSIGAVHLYRLRDDRWQHEQKVFAPDPSPNHNFGATIALGRDILAVGAPLDSERASHAGALYTLRFDGEEWIHEEKLFSGNPRDSDHFPRSIAVWGNTIAAADFGVFKWRVSSVFIYERGPGGWARVARLLPSGSAHAPQVAINDRFVVIGSAGAHRYKQGSGTAYVFEKLHPGRWEQIIELEPSDSTYGGAFGSAVAVAGEIIAVGARGDDEQGPLAGAAYLFRGFSADCNNNQQADICDISQGIVPDDNANGLPDDCEGACCVDGGCALMTATECAAGGCERNPIWNCDGDVDGDGQVNPVDVGLVAAAFGSTRERDLCSYDLDCNGRINPTDVGIVQSLFGLCNEPRSACGGGTWTEGVDCGDFECP